jgi:hypothetical protein
MRLFTLLALSITLLPAQSKPVTQSAGDYHLQPDPIRDPWQKPEQVISALSFSASETVAVLENGYPYFAPRIAPLVNKVYAISNDARAFQGKGTLPLGITPIVATSSSPKVAGLNLDTLIMVDILQSLPQRTLYYAQLLSGLRPGGRLVIIDRILPSTIPLSQELNEQNIRAEVGGVGLTFVQSPALLSYQFFLIFRF